MKEEVLPLISVIVPVYNVEKYLRRCVDSILNQTYPNIEIILVNDGSTDGSWEICKEFATNHPSITALKKDNGGLSSARNFGLKYAHGVYVGFIDSDDWISSDMYMTLFNIMANNDADAAQINYMLAANDTVCRSEKNLRVQLFHGREQILHYYLKSSTTGSGAYSVWRCLFALETAKKYRFREGKVNEDIDYKYKVLSCCKRFVVSDKICYYYFQSGDSISTGVLKPRDFDLYEAAEELEKLTDLEENDNIRFLGKVKKARTPFSLLCRIAYYGISEEFKDKATVVRYLLREHRQNIPILLKAPLPLSRKFLTLMFGISFPLTKMLIKIAKKI